jgi:predicted metal-binding membrane protein
MASSLDRRSFFLPLVVGNILLAWLTLVGWELSPYGRYLNHGQWTEIGLAESICHALPGGPIVLPAVLYVSGWLLMTVAIMLPSVVPLLNLFRRLTEERADRGTLLSLIVVGYLVIWCGFGLAAHLADAALHMIVLKSAWLTLNGWFVGACLLALAGVFQFTALKYHCLDKCRTPFSFINQYWRGQSAPREALRLGLRHGVFCVGCCWAIMLLMFVVGTGSIGWMLTIGAIMATEKNMPWEKKLSVPLGVALLVCSAGVVIIEAL